MSTAGTGVHTERFRVRITDRCGGITAVAGWLQETAAAHARLLGFSNRRMNEAGVAWVLARLAVRVDEYPGVGETVRVRTWPKRLDRLRGLRDFRILAGDGRELGVATSTWVALDVEKRRVAPMPKFVGENYPAHDETALELTDKNLPSPGEPEHKAAILTRAADMDENGHVNNVRLLEWALEASPPGLPRSRPRLADIAFRMECLHPDAVTAHCAVEEGGSLLHWVTRGDGKEALRVRTIWE